MFIIHGTLSQRNSNVYNTNLINFMSFYIILTKSFKKKTQTWREMKAGRGERSKEGR